MPQRKKEQVLLRRKEVADLYLKGWFQADIAEKVGVTQQQVSNDLKVIYRMWRSSSIRDFDEMKDRELIKIDKLELTYWNAWTRSLELQKKEKKKYRNAELDELNKEENSSDGDSRYLQGIQWCINKRCDILGINAPEKHSHEVTLPKEIKGITFEK